MTNYIIFACSKCNQYTYAKSDQKGKKCPRCGRGHVITEVNGEIVESLVEASNLVRKLQSNFAGQKPRLESKSFGFSVLNQKKSEEVVVNKKKSIEEGISYKEYLICIKNLKAIYTEMPAHIYSMFLQKKGLSEAEINQFSSVAIKENKLSYFFRKNQKYYLINC